MKGIRLLQTDERLTYTTHGVTFTYSRPTPEEIDDLQDKHTHREELDSRAFREEIFRLHIHGWEGNIHAGGEPLEFDPNLLLCLPTPIQMELSGVLTGNVSGEDEEINPI